MRNFPVEDTVAINLQFANGALGSFMLSDTAACPRSWEQTAGEQGLSDLRGRGLLRDRGYERQPLGAHDAAQDLRAAGGPFLVEALPGPQVEIAREDPIRLQMEHFGAVVRGEAQPVVSAADGLANLRVTEAITEAARTGAIVRL